MAASTFPTNGHTASQTDADLDVLYSWIAPQTPPPPPLPEAAFSLTLKGRLDGIEALFTVRGQSAVEFKANLAAVRGLLDPVETPPAQRQGEGFCLVHQCAMQENEKDGRRWFSHKTTDDWCKGKVK